MQTLNVLIVDDELELRKSVSSILKSTLPEIEFQIEEASNGLEAVQKVHANDYDLVLMDVRMPELDGLEVHYLMRILAERPWASSPSACAKTSTVRNDFFNAPREYSTTLVRR